MGGGGGGGDLNGDTRSKEVNRTAWASDVGACQHELGMATLPKRTANLWLRV